MRVLLADDQAKVRSALRLLLEQQPDIEVLGEAVDATGLLDWLNATCPDLVLLDWELLDLTPEVLPVLRERHPSLRVIAISGQPEARLAALAAGGERLRQQGRPARTAAGRGARMPTY